MAPSSPPLLRRRIAAGVLTAAVSLGLVVTDAVTGAAADGSAADEPAQG